MKTRILLLLMAVLVSLPVAAYEPADNAGLSKKEQRRTLRGYNCFVDMGYAYDVDGNSDDWVDGDWISVSTTHGYQFNDYFFLGGGLVLGVNPKHNYWHLPVFAEARVNFLDRRVTPFFVYRIGSSFVNIEDVTLYEMMMLGLRIALTEKSALNLSCGLEMNFGAYWSGGYALHIGYEF